MLCNLSGHLTASRLIRYRCVVRTPALAPLRGGDLIWLTKRLENVEGGNPWRQLTEGKLERRRPDGSFEELGEVALDPGFLADQLDRRTLDGFVGFAVLTLHDDLQTEPRWLTPPGVPDVAGLSASPTMGLRREVSEALAQALEPIDDETLQRYAVRLSPSWMDAAERACARPETICFAVASCQYPPGLVDREPSQAALAKLADRLEDTGNAAKPQVLLLLGDQVYVDETAGLFEPAARDPVDRAYVTTLRLPAMRRVLRQVPTFAVLDDHEVKDNWQAGAPPVDEGQRALMHYRQHWYKLLGMLHSPMPGRSTPS